MTKAKDTAQTPPAPTIAGLLKNSEDELSKIAAEREKLVANFNVSIGVSRGKEVTLTAQIEKLRAIIDGEKQGE